MSIQNLNTYDPFADEGDAIGDEVGTQQNYIHIRVQQRNGRKTLTTLQGLPKGASLSPDYVWHGPPDADCDWLGAEYDPKKLLKAFKKEFACNGTLVDDEENGQIIQLQGDQRLKISNFLIEEGIPKSTIKLHGF
ncbi:eukaryotic translation initiation factor SUI1 [Exidia glandulosa HHB12029]|uniref:Eukaryotic translation initiation factor SUI1 n=1 Tax=Exidia glandulosa HHB12029 TaxID=1314781 RepID=A0A165BT16_EXIGL|nr:eukaryotic translation initiation factor SUI1 [Exidia glandulosa HHB12029]